MCIDTKNAVTLLDKLQKAIKAQDKNEIRRLYQLTEKVAWIKVPTDIADIYDDLVDEGNEVLLDRQNEFLKY